MSATTQCRSCRMPQPVDFVVDRRVFLDVGVARGNIRLWLVIVVVRHEVLDAIVRKELAHFLRQLCRQALVRRQDQGWSLHLLNRPSNGGRLARPRDPQQCLESIAALDACGKFCDGTRLISGRGVVRYDLEGVLGAGVRHVLPSHTCGNVCIHRHARATSRARSSREPELSMIQSAISRRADRDA